MPTDVATPLPTGVGLELCAIWLNDVEDLTDMCAFRYAGDSVTITSTVRVEVRQLANRRRLIRRSSKVYDSFSLTLRSCTADQVQWLRDHVGRLLVYRDPYGSKAFVVFTDSPREVGTDHYSMQKSHVKVTFDQIDYSEAA